MGTRRLSTSYSLCLSAYSVLRLLGSAMMKNIYNKRTSAWFSLACAISTSIRDIRKHVVNTAPILQLKTKLRQMCLSGPTFP